MDLNKQKNQSTLSPKKVSKLLVFAILANALVIIFFVTFVFGLRPDLFEIDTNRLDRQMILYIDSINKNIDEYSARIKKIAASYPFDEFIQSVLIGNDVSVEKEKILSLFRSGEHTFSSVSIFMIDGQNIFSVPVNMFQSQVISNIPPYSKMPLVVYDKNYDGINFTQNITNAQGITTAYLNASVDKKVFSKTPSKNKFILFDNGIIFYDDSIDINSVSKDSLSLMIRNTKKDNAELLKIDSTPYLLYSSSLDKIQNFNIAIIVKDISMFQKYLRYIILSLFSISFVIMLILAFIENRKNSAYAESDILNDLENELEDFSDELYSKELVKEKPKNTNYYDKKVIEKITDDFPIENLDDDDTLTVPFVDEDEYLPKQQISENKKNIFEEELENTLEEDIMIKDGLTLEEEINKKEEEYFSTKEAFNVSLDEDFLSSVSNKKDKIKTEENDEDEKITLEESYFNNIEMDKDDMYEETEIPKIPDSYFDDNENNIDGVYQYKNIIELIKKHKFIDESFDEIIDFIEQKSDTNIKKAIMLKLTEDETRYVIDEEKNISFYTKSTFQIDTKEPLFTKFLCHKKPLYVKKPFDSVVISKKFEDEEKENTSSMLFMPIEKNNGVLENFFIALF